MHLVSIEYMIYKGTSGGVTVSKLDWQTYTSEFESHWAPRSVGLVPHQSKALCKLQYMIYKHILKITFLKKPQLIFPHG